MGAPQIYTNSLSNPISFSPFSTLEGRLNVKIRDYVAKYSFGTPVAGNFFQAQYDDYVPTIRAHIK